MAPVSELAFPAFSRPLLPAPLYPLSSVSISTTTTVAHSSTATITCNSFLTGLLVLVHFLFFFLLYLNIW